MNLLNLIEDTTTGYDNLRALMQASQSGQDAVLNVGGETVTLDPMETRWMFSKYKAFNKAGRQEEFLNHLADPVKFDQHMKQLRQLIDKQKNFRGSVPGQRGVEGDVPVGVVEGDNILHIPHSDKMSDEERHKAILAKHPEATRVGKTPGHYKTKDGDLISGVRGVRKITKKQDMAEKAVEEIAVPNPEKPTTEAAGKINWERMIKDYMDNKPYSEFEFSDDRPLTIYRSQVYAILKDFGRMKPPQKVNMILTTFGDKYAMVNYLDKLRAKGMMPKKVPAYVAPGTSPVSPGQMTLPGMETPKIKESEAQKKNSELAELDQKSIVNPKVARAFQLARARQSAAGSDIEAFVKDELEKAEQAQAEIEQLKADNAAQDSQMQQLARVVQQQDQAIQQLQPTPAEPVKEPEVVDKELVPISKDKAAEKPAKDKEAEKEPAREPAQQPSDVAQPAPAQKPKPPKPPKVKPSKKPKPKPQPKPEPEVSVPDNVIQGPWGQPAAPGSTAPDDDVAAALSGIDIPMTGTYGAGPIKEDHAELHIGDPVIITGNVEFDGKTGDIAGFGRDKHFVIVDLYNFGKHAFHASNVKYNDYADQEVDEAETHDKTGAKMHQAQEKFLLRHNGKDIAFFNTAEEAKQAAQELMHELKGTATVQRVMREMQTKMDRFSVNQPPPGGTNKQREEFLDARDRLFRQMNGASPGEREAIRLKIADLEGRAQAQGIKIRESDDLNRAGYNAIKTVSDWEEKMRVMRELQKDQVLMSDPEARASVQQRIGDLLKIGMQQGYLKEALSDKAMAVLRGLKTTGQAQTAAPVSAEKQAEIDAWAQDFQRNVAGPMGRQVVAPQPQIDLNVPVEPARRRGRPSNAQRAQEREEYETIKRKIAQLDELLKMKEQIDKLFLKAQNVRGGIYPGLQADIESEELYPVPEQNFDKEYADLRDKYTRDLAALQKFLAMKKAMYREGQEPVNESASLVRLQRARQRLVQQLGQGVAEGLQPTEKVSAVIKRVLGDKLLWGRRISQLIKSPRAKFDRYQMLHIRVYDDFGPDELNPQPFSANEGQPLAKKLKRELIRAGYPVSSDLVIYPEAIMFNVRKPTTTTAEQGVAEAQTDYQKRRQRERDVDAGRPVKPLPKNVKTDYQKKREQDRKDMELGEQQMCPECGGPSFSDMILAEKQDACYHKVKSRYKVWPSAYASGALVQCRKKGAANWGNKGKK